MLLKHHVLVSTHESDLQKQLINFLKAALAEHVLTEADKPFVIGYSGGSMPKTLATILKTGIEEQHRPKIRLFPVDERLVPLNNPDNNTAAYLEQLAPIFSEDQFAVLPSDVLDNGEAAADFLGKKLSEWSGETESNWPRINVLFLGMGPDGHTCSLFPSHQLLKEAKKWTVAIEDSPKPPPRRITITIPVINAAQNVAFIVTGAEKADVLEKIIDQHSTDFPVGLIELKKGRTVYFFLDSKAASKLAKQPNSSMKITGHL